MHPLKGRKQTAEHVAKRVAAKAEALRADPERLARMREVALQNLPRVMVMPEETKAKISASMAGKQNCLGRKLSIGHRQKLAAYWAGNREKHNFYVDGKGGERVGERITAMGRVEYRLWREAVFKRDNWTCQECGLRGGKIHADHIKPWSTHPELRYDVANGRALCVSCHKATDTFGSKARKHAPQEALACRSY